MSDTLLRELECALTEAEEEDQPKKKLFCPEIDPEYAWLKYKFRNTKLRFIDVREEEEWKRGHISGALNIPHHRLLQEIAGVAKAGPEGTELVLYCQSGQRSVAIGLELKRAGYYHTKSIKGGLTAWEAKGYPVIIKSAWAGVVS